MAETRAEVVSQTIMYILLTIFTIMFTYQYFRRVLYMAFFTIIAPLITLTYPLDKIKDSKAQAFTMWIKEYVFNSLIQIVHLVVYYTLVGSAQSLVEVFPLYGVIAIGLISQGERIIRKMFGFNNADTIGTMKAAAIGGVITTALKKLKSASQAGKNKIRTSSEENEDTGVKGGATALARRYGKQVGGSTLGTLAGIQGGMIGLAAGISQGDMSAAFTGALAGKEIGQGFGQGLVNNIDVDDTKKKMEEIKNTFQEGAYGADAVRTKKFNDAFRNSSTYEALQNNSNFSEEKVQAMLNSGITDQESMTQILDSGLDIEDALKYHAIAEHCPPEILYDKSKMKVFCKELREMDDSFGDMSYGKIRDNVKKFI